MGDLSEGQGVYIISNKAMPGLVKIGATKNIKARLKTLSGTSVPVPFGLESFQENDNERNLEQKVHRVLTKYRERENREFFNCSPDLAKGALIAINNAFERENDFPTQTIFPPFFPASFRICVFPYFLSFFFLFSPPFLFL